MADIDVVHRKSANWMWWAVAALIVLALVFMLTRNRDQDREVAPRSAPGSSLVSPLPLTA